MFVAKRAQERCHSSAPVMSFQRVTLESKKKDDVIPVLDTGMALLHSTLSSDGLRQIYVMISNLAIPISVNLLSK
ncbi:hypothetical protein ACJZL1_06365 [Wolbachia endosymbiont of Rhagoletis indifferens]|uniref:hypothetical protein n=1 Tax=Wolbachia endosymbiont of Rhagoletis indifferens TaxID=3383250 RepID=UPI003AF35C03